MTLQIASLRLADVYSPYLEHVDLILTRKLNAGMGYVFILQGISLILFISTILRKLIFLMEKENSYSEVEKTKLNGLSWLNVSFVFSLSSKWSSPF